MSTIAFPDKLSRVQKEFMQMKTTVPYLLVLALALGASAPPAHAAKVDDPALYTVENLKKNLILGKTTKEEVRAMYGEPYGIDRASAKEGAYETSWRYYPSRSHGEKARERVTGFLKGMIPGRAGTAADVAQEHGAGSRNVKNFSLHIDFDRNGVVEDYRQDEGNSSENAL